MKLPSENSRPEEPNDLSFGVDSALDFHAIKTAFEKKFPNDDICWKWLFQYAKSAGLLRCHFCGKPFAGRKRKLRSFVCASCGKTTWITKGTLFDHVKKIRAWLAAIWFTEHGIVVSSLWLSRFAEIAQSSALNILRRLRIILEDYMDESPQLVATGLFTEIMLRRSILTPAARHPRSEEEEMCKKKSAAGRAEGHQESGGVDSDAGPSLPQLTQNPGNEDSPLNWEVEPDLNSPDPGANGEAEPDSAVPNQEADLLMSETGKDIYELLEHRSMTFDELSAQLGVSADEISVELTVLEVHGLVFDAGGGRYKRAPQIHLPSRPKQRGTKRSTEDRTEVVDTVEFVRVHFRGVSRKYLQMYAVARWCFERRERWRGGNLLNACWRANYITYEDIMAYVTPLFVKVDAD